MIGSAAGGARSGLYHWGMATFPPRRCLVPGSDPRTAADLSPALPTRGNDGRMNLFSALRTSMATCGWRGRLGRIPQAEVMVAPAADRGQVPRGQGVGMGH